jgi:glutathione synthase/RimK-type ligase-like ATP-grasp enzyme
MTLLAIRPYSMRSKSAIALSEALGCMLSQNPPTTHKIINWGGGGSHQGLNKPQHVSKAINKIETFSRLMGEARTPQWTTRKDEAKVWIQQGKIVVCRTTINGHSGQGIVIADTVDKLVDAPLYTQYIAKDAEYRIHVFNGQVIDQRQKVKAIDGRPITSEYINTHTNGYVFQPCRAPSDAPTQAIKAVQTLGLDFGAVDVITKESTHRVVMGGCSFTVPEAYVLEVNTAPGLVGQTITAYATAIKKYFNNE